MVPASFWYTKADDTTSTIFVPEFGGISLAQGLIQCTKKSLMPPCKCYAFDRTTLLHAYSRQVVDSKRVFLKTHLRYLPRGRKKKESNRKQSYASRSLNGTKMDLMYESR
jgi:hypothetical protein